jgi:glycosyltransferase involved in cell wall biosynthesis
VSPRAKATLALVVHRCQLLRLRLERLAAWLFAWRGRPRVLATACWDFPIYSQTFVYQELTQLAKHGFSLRFVYSKLNPRKNLPGQFASVWHARRRLILHPDVCAREYAYYTNRMPDRVDRFVAMVCHASGLSPDELRGHHHFQQAFAFTRMVEAYRPDYLHSYFFYEGTFFASCAAFLLDIPRGVSCYADHMLNDYALKIVPLHLELCTLVIATSARIKHELLHLAPGADGEKIVVKPNGINTSRFPVIALDEPGNGEPHRVVCVSRIEPKKGLIYLLEAVGTLRDRNVRIELHLLGGVDSGVSNDEYAKDLAARHTELRLDGIVHLEGRQTEAEIKSFFARSHLYVAPFIETDSGDKDGIPTSLLEAMASGMPVVATDAGSITEVIEDGRDGMIVHQRNPGALADAIQGLLRRPEQRSQLGHQASVKVRSHFDVSKCENVFHDRLRAITLARRR